MSRKTASTSSSCSIRSASVAESQPSTLADPRVVALEQVGQLVEGGPLVVDDEDASGAGHAARHWRATPGRELRAPARSPWCRRRARSRRPGRSRRRTRCAAGRRRCRARPSRASASPASARRTRSGSSPTPSSSTSITHSWSRSRATMRELADAVVLVGAASRPWRTAFSTSGWMQRKGTATGSTSGRDPQRHLEPVAEAGLLEQQVALDGAELLGERRVLAVAAEGVAGEVGELQQQLAGPVGVGADEAGDRAERVVDEVRADLGPQGAHLGLHQPGAGGVELGELELAGDPLRRPRRRPGPARRWRAGEHRRACRRRAPRRPAG